MRNELESSVQHQREGAGVTVLFGEHFQASENFDVVFREGMELVERTAAYLDGAGRAASKELQQSFSVLYATESMRLTTRLLDLASWLLIRRSLKDGEITRDEAKRKRRRVKLAGTGRPSHIKDFEHLPDGLRGLIEESFALHDRIVRLDKAMSASLDRDGGYDNSESTVVEMNPVGAQMNKLRRAFGR